MKKSFAPFFCLLAIVGATLAPSTHAEEAPAPPPAADEFVKQLEMLRNDPVARAAAKEAVSKRVEELRKSMSEAQPKFDQTRTQLQTATDQAAALRGKIDELTKQLTSAQAELEQIEKGFAETQQQLEAARQQQTETGTPLLVYEQTLALLNAIDAKPDAAKTEAPPAAPPTPAPAPEPPAAATPVPSADTSVAGKARAVLAANCVSCHGAEKQKAGLRLDSREALIKGGENGTSIIPGDAEQSKLIRAIRYDGELQMPPKGKLDQPSIDALIEWVKQGAPPWSTDAPAAAAEQTASAPATVTPAPVVLPAVDEKDRVSFNRDVRPIIQNNCFACHGPDPAARKAGLRLDVEAEAVEALSPGNRGKSEVYEHISASDPEKIMPPVSSGKKLTPEQIATLGKWIDQGAKYEQHWAFIPPVSPAVPEVQRKDWAKNDIDRFVLARLEKEGLTPSPEADKEKLIRRVSLDLTGLPPTPQDVDAFIADASPDAYEKLVDRLLASPEYGEHIARSWLDLARYADTNGYHIDNERYMWRWREWVIDAFNKNMPFDQFTVEQIAGDLLPNATNEQRLATGFNRNHMITFEGGIIPEEYRVQYVVDRVNTTSTVWMGLTAGCAQCHDHKFDPIKQKEYFGLYAFYNSVAEQGSDGNTGNAAPLMKAPSAEQMAKLAELDAKVNKMREEMRRPLPEIDTAQAAWEKEQGDAAAKRWTTLEATEVKSSGGATFKAVGDGSWLVEGMNADKDTYEIVGTAKVAGITAIRLEALADPSLPQSGASRSDVGNFVLTEFEAEYLPLDKDEPVQKLVLSGANADYSQDTFDVANAVDGKAETGWAVSGFEKRENRTAVFVPAKAFGSENGIRIRVRLKHESQFAKHNIGRFRLSVTNEPSMAPAQAGPWYLNGPFRAENGDKAYETAFEPEKGVDINTAYDDGRMKWIAAPEYADGQENALKGDVVATYLYRTLTVPTARTLTLSLGSNDSIKVWLNGVEVHANPAKRPLKADEDKVAVELKAGENKLLLKIVNHGGAHAFFFRRLGEQFGNVPIEVEGALLAQAERTDAQKAALRDFYRRDHWPEWKGLNEQLLVLTKEQKDVDAQIPTAMVMQDLPTPRETFLLERGEYDKPTEKVEPMTPAVLPPLPADAPRNRLGLAKWLVEPAHPLTARVAVNRFWSRYFGTGFVKTLQDFGVQGEWPSHPELLDWLATEFVRTKWDVKGMQRLIVTSATYRQSSRIAPELYEKDPENRLLARGPRFRMDAEMVRDNALAASGLLVKKIGGRSVKPYQPAGLWEEVSFGDKSFTAQTFEQDHGEALFRRSMYTFWKRTAPPPMMALFDAPNREVCTAKRARTNTPLQALALMNDTQYVEAARALAQRTMKECPGTVEERIAWAFRLATSRKPSEQEAAVLKKLYEAQLEDYKQKPETAKELVSHGESPRDESLDVCELAAWTTVASTILNLDETVTKG